MHLIPDKHVPKAYQDFVLKATSNPPILQADAERTRLALERSRMQAEDNRGKVMRDFADLRSRIISRTEMIVVGLEQERDDISMLNAELEDKFDAIMQHSPELIPDLVHTTPNDTEYEAGQKFMRLFHQ